MTNPSDPNFVDIANFSLFRRSTGATPLPSRSPW